jgi:hypothetical protein
MRVEELLHGIEPQWRESFARFVQTGEAEDEFLNYLNLDKNAQQAVEAAFDAQAQAFQAIAEELKKTPAPDAAASAAVGTVDISTKAAQAVEDVMLLSPDERRQAMQKTASALKASLGPDQKELLVETLMDTLGVGALHKAGVGAHK